MYMVAIGNNPRPQRARRQGRPHGARLPARERAHGVEQVCHARQPFGHGGQQLRVTGVGVSRADVQPAGDQLAQLPRCEMLRREGDDHPEIRQ